ncbi:MAG: hypothetical protein IJF37_09255 [Lachnospiraceae bacterium]|nr:hypothetical protein [Lachnospiraceae bacterium]
MGEFEYASRENQLKNANKLNMTGFTFVTVLMICMFMLQNLAGNGVLSTIVGSGLLFISLVVTWVFYLKNKAMPRLIFVELGSFAVAYGFVVLTGNNQMVFMYMLPIIVGALVVDDYKPFRIMCIIYAAIIDLKFIIVMATVYSQLSTTEVSGWFVEAIVATLFFIAAAQTTSRKALFNRDTFAKVDSQNENMSTMLNDVLEIAEVVKDGMSNVQNIMGNLEEATDNVHLSLVEIGQSTQITAENVQEQAVMTKDIQESINATKELSDNIVQVAENSSEAINESKELMGEMETQSEKIKVVNDQVVVSMEQLQKKTEEVRNIADMIFEISSQTNLLALNASIESARAGEAGRGFAVVADQIRELADQTRKSTESIAAIITELNENANEVADKLQDSVVAMNKQNELIKTTSENIDILGGNINSLSNNVSVMDDRIEALRNANDTIVENISHLSATSEEVTASADVAKDFSEKSKESFGEARNLITDVSQTAEKLEKYL